MLVLEELGEDVPEKVLKVRLSALTHWWSVDVWKTDTGIVPKMFPLHIHVTLF